MLVLVTLYHLDGSQAATVISLVEAIELERSLEKTALPKRRATWKHL